MHRFLTYHVEAANVTASNDVIVKPIHYEIPDKWTPNHDMIYKSPIGGVESYLDGYNYDQYRGYYSTQQHVIGQYVAFGRNSILISTCVKNKET